MPYARNSQLPKSVKHVLPPVAQTIYRKAFNNADEKYGELRAYKIAWSAVKRVYRKGEKAKWVKI